VRHDVPHGIMGRREPHVRVRAVDDAAQAVPVTHPTVKRAKVTIHSTSLCCQVRRAVGWSAECACGQRFPIRRDPDDAKMDARVHTASCQVKASAS
jgi:hypothetical protein